MTPIQHSSNSKKIKAVRQVVPLMSPEGIIREVAHAYGMKAKALREQRGRIQEAKGAAMTLVWDLCGLSLREIGALFAAMDYAAVAQQVRRTRLRDENRQLNISLAKLQNKCQRI